MKRISNAARLGAPMPAYALQTSCALVLFVYSAMPRAATPTLTTPAPLQNAQASPLVVAQARFGSAFLTDTPGSTLDVKRYERGNPIIPGEYLPDIYLSGMLTGRERIIVRANESGATVCFNRALLEKLNVDLSLMSTEMLAALADPAACVDLRSVVPDARVAFDHSALRLDIDIPQAALRRTARGSVDPRLWDSGVTAAMVGYSGNLYRNVARGVGSDSAYLGLNVGVNIAGWMFHHDGAFNWTRGASNHYSNANTYVQHDVTSLKARVTIGDANTSGEVFDTFAFRGVQLATDDRMLPDSLRGYAPVVRGIADSNARVTIRQGTAVIYDQPVPPGPFVIDDLYPTGYGGDLDVIVTEADGRIKSFKVPYASVVQLLRPGLTRYSAVVGNVRNMGLSRQAHVLQAALQHGLTNTVTLYGGLLAASHYASVLGGGALSTPLGAIALDLSGAQTSAPGETLRGVSIRATYNKLITATDSNISVAAYRFSSSGFLDLDSALLYVDAARGTTLAGNGSRGWRPRNRASISASQALGEKWGNLFLSGYTQNYWQRRGADTQFQAGYSNRFRAVSYGVTVTRARSQSGQMDMQYMLSASLPLGHTSHAPYLSMNLVRDSAAGMTAQTVVTGLAGDADQASYALEAARDPGNTYSGSASGTYRTPYTSIHGAVGGGAHYYSGSMGLSGSLVAHPGGVTASPYAGNTVAVIAAPAAAGAVVSSYPGIKLDPLGYAVMPYLTPYRLNEITLDPKGIPDDVELQETSQRVAPRLGAVVMVKYATRSGRAALITSTLPDGQPMPFGATVFDASGNSVGTVTQGGRIYARISQAREQLTLKWGPEDANECVIDVVLPERAADKKTMAFEHLSAPCTSIKPSSKKPSTSPISPVAAR